MSIADTPAQSQPRLRYVPLPRFTSDLLVMADPEAGWYQINSRSRAGLRHRVNPTTRICTCEAFGFHGACPHLVELDDWLEQQRQAEPLREMHGATEPEMCRCGRRPIVLKDDPEWGSCCAQCWHEALTAPQCAEPGCLRPAVSGSLYCRGCRLAGEVFGR